jgi:hypothetical protein
MRDSRAAIHKKLQHQLQNMSALSYGCDSQIQRNIYKIEAA